MISRAAHSSWLCLVLLLGALPCPRASAQAKIAGDVDASREHFDRGVEYFQDGDLRAALIEFKRAYSTSPNYRVLYNLGQVCNELREYVDAQSYFQRYLADGADDIEPGRKHEVEGVVTKLAGRIASLVLTSNEEGAEFFVDDVAVGRSPLTEPVRVSTGTRSVSAALSGRPRIHQSVEAAGGDTLSVRFDFPRVTERDYVLAPPPQEQPSATGHGPGPVLWLGIGTGVLAVGTGVLAYLAASDASKYHDAVDRRTTARELDSLDKRASAKALAADILLGATVVTAAVTLVVALQGHGSRDVPPPADGARTHLSVGAGSVQLAGGFD